MTADFATGPKADRHPLDWYVEQAWVVRALLQHVEFDPDNAKWDPACGIGTIPEVFSAAGFQATGTDIVCRGTLERLWFGEHDFLGPQSHYMDHHGALDIVMNPPFSYREGIAEAFVRKALKTVRAGHVCALLPLAWRASERRYDFFEEFPPAVKWVFCDRPSMPPGDALGERDAKGELTAWARGKVDYCWYVWDQRQPGTPTIERSIKPRTREQKRLDREEDFRRVGVLPPLPVEVAA